MARSRLRRARSGAPTGPAFKYGFEPIVVSGKFVVLNDDPMGLYYRLTDAVPVTP